MTISSALCLFLAISQSSNWPKAILQGGSLFRGQSKAQASESRIVDTDYSSATTELAKRNIIQQAAQAMLAQANQQPQMVLQLLK